jgi:hypothetical protein
VISKLISFQLSFEDDIARTLQFLEYQNKWSGVDPLLGSAVLFLDVNRSARPRRHVNDSRVVSTCARSHRRHINLT